MNENIGSFAVLDNDFSVLGIADMMLESNIAETEGFAESYRYISDYAQVKALENTAVALPLVLGLTSRAAGSVENRFNDSTDALNSFKHCMSVCRMLMELYIPLSRKDEDIMLAAALCHILPESLGMKGLRDELSHYNIAPEVYELLSVIYRSDDISSAELRRYYKNLRNNKLALLIALSDRSNMVEQLYDISAFSARRRIHETRTYFLPLCVYAKEHYTELISAISILMEKMRNLIELSDILLTRFEARETELSREILALEEENAMLRGMIAFFE